VPCYKAHTAWFLGYDEKDPGGAKVASLRAQELAGPFHHAIANGLLAVYWTYRAQPEIALNFAHSTVKISDQHGIFHWSALGGLMQGWALAKLGQTKEGLPYLEDGIARWQSTGAEMALATFLAWQADAYASAGRVELGLACTEEGLRTSKRLKDNYYDAELFRIRGELLLRTNGPNAANEAEVCFTQAIRLARERKAKPHELRASVSLARMWQNRGKTNEARRMLRKIVYRYPKGFDTPERKAAKELLTQFS
jgi:predicted ATPase